MNASHSKKDRLSALFREVEIEVGSTELSLWAIQSLREAVESFKAENFHDFFKQLLKLCEHINTTEPKFATIIDGFEEVLKMAYEQEIHHPEKNYPFNKKSFLKCLDRFIREKKHEQINLIHHALEMDVNGKGILVFDHSRTVQSVLKALFQKGQRFSVIVAEQDPEKTNSLIETLNEAKIPFKVVPSYMVSHLNDCIDFVFLGGVTLKNTMDFVMDTGSSAIVSQFHLLEKPIYSFLSTKKFSLWSSQKRHEIYQHSDQRKHYCKPILFERIKFSHDRVPIKLFSKIITEKGIFTPKQMEDFYKEQFKQRKENHEKFQKKLNQLKKKNQD